MAMALLLVACDNDGRKVKKFLSRMNAREINAASTYIYPGDHPRLSIYADVLEKNPNTFLKLVNKSNIEKDGQKGVAVEFECINTTPYYRNYMERLHLLHPDGHLYDTIYIRETNNGKKLSFNWAPISGENLKLAKIQDSTINSMNIRSGRGQAYAAIGTLDKNGSVIINDYPADAQWVPCFTIDENCCVVRGYIYRASLSAQDSEYFSLNIFDSMSLVVAVLVFVVIGVVFVAIGAFSEALFQGGGLSWIFIVVMILGLLYVAYELLEKILFELFIINLPY